MKRISKSIATQIACRPRHVVASGESSQVKSGRRRSRLAPLASRALLAVHLHSACSVYLHCFAVHLHSACCASLLCISACSTSVPNSAQLAQRALLAVHLHSACSAPLISAGSTSVPHSAHLAMALMRLCLQAFLRCLDTCRHYITTISPNLIVTSSPTILFKWLV